VGHSACTEPQCLYKGALAFAYFYKIAVFSNFCFLFSVNSKEIIMSHPEVQPVSPEYANRGSFSLHCSSWREEKKVTPSSITFQG
jgi:hypothetical protein